MKCLILGFEVTSENSYWEHVVAHPQIEKVFIVDVASKKDEIAQFIFDHHSICETIYFDDSSDGLLNMPYEEERVKNLVDRQDIRHALISASSHNHLKYLEFCMKHNLHILCDRPITLDSENHTEDVSQNSLPYLQKWYESPVDLFQIVSPQSHHKSDFFIGYSKQAKFQILNHFFFNQKADTQHLPSQDARDILIGFYNATTKGLNHTDFRFAVEIILEHKRKYLICKRRSDVKVAPGIWNVPGGKVKFNESMEEAVLRETKEETNLDLEECECIGYQFFNKKHQRLVYTYYSTVSDISNLKVDPTEFDDYTWVTTNDLAQYPSLNRHIVQLLQNH